MERRKLLNIILFASFYFIIVGGITTVFARYQFHSFCENTDWPFDYPITWVDVFISISPFVLLIFVVISANNQYSKVISIFTCLLCMLLALNLLDINDPQHGNKTFTGTLILELLVSVISLSINILICLFVFFSKRF